MLTTMQVSSRNRGSQGFIASDLLLHQLRSRRSVAIDPSPVAYFVDPCHDLHEMSVDTGL